MAHDELQQLLHKLSDQTGRPMPDADQVERFLQSPASQLLLRSLTASHSDSLHSAAAMAKAGDYRNASTQLQQFLTTAEGQALLQKLAQNGAPHE